VACGGFGCGGAFGGGGLVVVACQFVGDTVVAKVVAAAVGCCIGYCWRGDGDRCSPCFGCCGWRWYRRRRSDWWWSHDFLAIAASPWPWLWYFCGCRYPSELASRSVVQLARSRPVPATTINHDPDQIDSQNKTVNDMGVLIDLLSTTANNSNNNNNATLTTTTVTVLLYPFGRPSEVWNDKPTSKKTAYRNLYALGPQPPYNQPVIQTTTTIIVVAPR
jgi:hypothetical protein